jgi:hypothetical protein
MAFGRAVLGTVIDFRALDPGKDFTCAVMEGADRAALYPVRLETGFFELLQRVAPIRESSQFSWPPAEQSWYENDVARFHRRFFPSQLARVRRPQIGVATGPTAPVALPFAVAFVNGGLIRVDGAEMIRRLLVVDAAA